VLQPFTQTSTYAQAQPLGCVTAAELLSLQRTFPQRFPVLLQSAAATHEQQHDVLMALPQQRLTLLSNNQLKLPDAIGDYQGNSFLEALDRWWQHEQVSMQSSALPFSGGWFLYLGYELAAQIEPTLQATIKVSKTYSNEIVAQAIRLPAAIVRDTTTNEAWFVAEHEVADQFGLIADNLKKIRAQLYSPAQVAVIDLREEPSPIFIAAVERALEYIAAGDVYQANLSRGWNATLTDSTSAQDIYQQLCTANPAPFAGIALLNDNEAIISSSPERLIGIRNGEVSTRPIAGTRPRSSDHQRDMQLMNELRCNTKEQAEHVMLLDLERNDLGRFCKAGTVHVDEYMIVETYAHVHHIVSNVRGQLRDDVTPGQAIAAVFPGGTITGCPKVRCMQVIAELEGVRRGPYTGSMGYLNRDGSMDLNILIRTLHMQGSLLEFRAGAGIVADSIPERELDETRAKARGLLRALGKVEFDQVELGASC
jgi:anthranilate synthase component 1